MENLLDEIQSQKKVVKLSYLWYASFFGGPLALAYFIALNFKSVKKPQYVLITWIFAFIYLTLDVISIVLFPNLDLKVGFGIHAIITFTLIEVVRKFQGKEVDVLFENINNRIGIGGFIGKILLFLVITIILYFGVLVYLAVIEKVDYLDMAK